MDGIKKKLEETPKSQYNPYFQERITPTPRQKKRDELFISHAESQSMDRQREKTFQKGQLVKKIMAATFAIITLFVICMAGYFLWKTYDVSKKMNSESGNPTSTLAQDMRAMVSSRNHALLKGEETGRINILLMGAAGQHKPGGNLTDTVMIMSIDTKNKKVALLSLPRDFYVPIPNSNTYTKLNSLYPIGIKNGLGADYAKQTVEKITGLSINYYAAVDFDAFQKIINDIGGINIINERDIYDPRYPGPNYSYKTFALSKGFHNLNGETALEYVRERHDDPEGDFGRAKRQQQVIQAVKNKMFSMQTLFNVVALNDIFNTLGDNIKTDVTFNDLDRFIALSKTLDLQNITNVVVDAWKPNSLLKASHIQSGNTNAFILVPRVGNYSEIQDVAQNIFNQTEIKKRQEQIANEDASIGIINQSSDPKLASKIQSLLSDKFGMKNVRIIASLNNTISDKTIINDATAGQKIFTLDELIKKIPTTLSQDNFAQNDSVDLIIVLGDDIVSMYKYEEASIDDFNKAQDTQDNIDFTNPI